MRLEALERPAGAAHPLQRLDARVKLLFTLTFVVAVVAVPIGQWRILGGLGLVLALLIGLSGASPRTLALSWAGFSLMVGFLALLVAPGMPARAEHGLLTVVLFILAKNSLAFLTMMVLAHVTSWRELLVGLRRLGLPHVLVATLLFMERYLHVLGEELGRMMTARRARSFQRRSGLSWRLLTSMISMLLLRSLERAERVQSAMTARGWDGTLRTLED
ncbi:MAG: energy-coupling factor transporter transmembrane component T family protein [Isosphaeraceae bacterium]